MKRRRKGLLKCIAVEVLIILLMAILIHYGLMGFNDNDGHDFLAMKFNFPKSLAIALFFRLSFYPIGYKKMSDGGI